MVKRGVILILALALPGLAMAVWSHGHSIATESAQFTLAASSEGRTAIHGLFVPNQIIDLGSIAPTGMVDASFIFENRSDKPMEITDVNPQCGCTAVKVGIQVIRPETTAYVSVRLDATRAGGSPFRKGILATVNTADSTNYIHLYLTGTVDSSKQFVIFDDVVDIGDVIAGTQIHRKMLFRGGTTSLDALPREIPVTLGEDGNIEVSRRSGLASLATQSAELVITVPANAPVSSASMMSTIAITPTGLPSQKQSIRVIGRVSHPIGIEPKQILMQTEGGKGCIARLSLKSIVNSPFSITHVYSDLPLNFEFGTHESVTNSITIVNRPSFDTDTVQCGWLKVEFGNSISSLSVPVVIDSTFVGSVRSATAKGGS